VHDAPLWSTASEEVRPNPSARYERRIEVGSPPEGGSISGNSTGVFADWSASEHGE